MLDKLNPLKFLLDLGLMIIDSSYWICLIGSIIGMILYLYGLKKCKNSPFIGVAVYIIIRMLGAVLNVQ